jgi:hypothetical protein
MFYHGYRHRQILAAWQSADGKIEKTAIGKIANLPDQSSTTFRAKALQDRSLAHGLVDRAHETSTHCFDCPAVVWLFSGSDIGLGSRHTEQLGLKHEIGRVAELILGGHFAPFEWTVMDN